MEQHKINKKLANGQTRALAMTNGHNGDNKAKCYHWKYRTLKGNLSREGFMQKLLERGLTYW